MAYKHVQKEKILYAELFAHLHVIWSFVSIVCDSVPPRVVL